MTMWLIALLSGTGVLAQPGEQVQARGFIEDKLCELGLGECSLANSLQYVQPVRVIPVGEPIQALPMDSLGQDTSGTLPLDRVFNIFGGKPNANRFKNRGKGNRGRPKPRPSYGAPKPSYGAPKPSYGAPKPSYGAPKPTYSAPKPSYGVPRPGYGAPSVGYGAPGSISSGGEKDFSRAPALTSYSPPGGLAAQAGAGPALSRPGRGGGAPACYCTQESLCPAGLVVANRNYSSLIDPRVKATDLETLGAGLEKDEETRALELELAELARTILEVRALRRGKRSPDGHGHHGDHHGHHQDHGHHDGEHETGFGPQGVRPPICGGPGSGYVCCRTRSTPEDLLLQTLQAADFGELNTGVQEVRDERDQFSQFGQCGRRAAHGTLARIRNSEGRRQYTGGQGADSSPGARADSLPAASTVRRVSQGSLAALLRGAATVDADFGEYPWQAAVLKKDEYDNVYVCGAALIDSSHLLTATHCINKFRPEELRIRLGEWDVHTDSEFHPNLEMDLLSISYHPNFHAGNLYNDIAIIKLDGQVDFQRNPHVSPVCLPDVFQDYSGQRCWVSGWGKDALGEEGAYQPVLKEVDVPVLGQQECEAMLQATRLGTDFLLHPGFVCAGGEDGKDACKGDGGGPLVCEVGGTWQLVGLVSWGVGCGAEGVPGVYTRVSHYNQWIQDMMFKI